MKKVLVSACLLGQACRYDGGDCRNAKVLAYLQDKKAIEICPEQLGGFGTPRLAAEIKDDLVIDINGKDVTSEFMRGAQAALAVAQANGCKLAILKNESPSCGKGRIFDGTFRGRLTEGSGVTASLLQENGIEVLTEDEI